MKRVFLFLLIPVLGWAEAYTPKKITTSFPTRRVIQHVLESSTLEDLEQSEQLGELANVSVRKAGEGRNLKYEVSMTYATAGLGQKGPSIRPCMLNAVLGIEVKNNQGITYSELSAPQFGAVVCAQNSPRPR